MIEEKEKKQMKRIKFPLVMGNGAEARNIEELRENFDMMLVTEYFSNGKLQRWLENNYYDDILETVQKLDSNEHGFGQNLAKALGIKWEDDGKINLQAVIKRTELKEQLKPYVSEEQLEEIEYIADTQEELEQLVRRGCGKIYLFGEEFCISEWMENVECIGINHPLVKLEIKNREEFKEKKIKLREVNFTDDEMKKIAMGDSAVDIYYELLNVLELYLENAQKTLH